VGKFGGDWVGKVACWSTKAVIWAIFDIGLSAARKRRKDGGKVTKEGL